MKTFEEEESFYGVLSEEFVAHLYEDHKAFGLGLCGVDRRKECEEDHLCKMETDCIDILMDLATSHGDDPEEVKEGKTEQAVEGFKLCCKVTMKKKVNIICEGSCTPEQFKRFGRKVQH